MTDDSQAIDLQAFTAIDQRRLLRVLSRVIDEEATHLHEASDSGEWERDRERLRVFCTLVSMIREMNDLGPGLYDTGPGRRSRRTL